MPFGMAWTRSRGTPQRERSATISRLFATQAVVFRAMPASKERAEQSLTLDDRQVEMGFAAAPRPHQNWLAEPLSCDCCRKSVQAAMDDVNHVIATPVSPQPGADATAPPQEGVDVPSAQIRGRAQEIAPHLNGPLALLRGRSPCETRRKQRHGGSAPGERLRQPSCLLCGAAEALGKIRRQDHDDSRNAGAGENIGRHADESASATWCRAARKS